MDLLQTQAAIMRTCIPHPPFQRTIDRFDQIFKAASENGLSDGFLLMGPSGVGKTQVCKSFYAKHLPYQEPERTVIPVLSFTMPANPLGKALYQKALSEFGADYTMGTESTLELRLIKLLKTCKVKVLVVDEAQHLIDRGGKKMHEKSADNLKNLMTEAGIAIILVGTDRVQELLKVNEQLRRRFSSQIQLKPWGPVAEVDINQVAGVLQALLANPAIELDHQHLIEFKFAKCLAYGSGGRISYIVKLVCWAVKSAYDRKSKILEMHDFERAFESAVWSSVAPKDNPFSKLFLRRQLTQYGEPFWVST